MLVRPATLPVLIAALSLTGAFAAEPAAEPEKQPQRICRGATKQLGSHIRTPRRCRTAEQWQQEDEAKARLPVAGQVTEGQDRGAQRPQH